MILCFENFLKLYLELHVSQKGKLGAVDVIFVSWLAGSINVLATAPLWGVAGRVKAGYKTKGLLSKCYAITLVLELDCAMSCM